MPKKSNLAKKAAVAKKNKTAIESASKSKIGVVGKVISALGNGGFRIHLEKGGETIGLIRGVFKGGRNSEAYLVAGMYVILSSPTVTPRRLEHGMEACDSSVRVPPTERASVMQEIIAVINTKRAFKELKDAGLIKEEEKDDLFEYEEEISDITTDGATMENMRISTNEMLAAEIDAI